MKLFGKLLSAMIAGAVLGLAGFTGWQIFALVTAMQFWHWSD